MFIRILQHTPVWVWILLAALVALGLTQTRARRMTLRRATLLPVAMVTLSLVGVVSSFGSRALPLLAWLCAAAVSAAAARFLGAWRGTTWSANDARFQVPGSWLPLTLILLLFAIKFSVAVQLALHPGLKDEALFSSAASLAYGFFSGLFLARASAFWTLIRRPASMQVARATTS